MTFKYAIFDLDMTLIDSIVPLAVGANLLAEEFSLPRVSYEEVFRAETTVPNCTTESLWQSLWGRCEPQWYSAYMDHIADKEYQAMNLFPGARGVLESLRTLGIPIALASNREYPRKALAAMGIEHLFRAVVGMLDVEHSKPAPDMIIKALQLMGAPADEALYICDSRGDLLAAAGAGVKVFSMTTGGHSSEELLSLGAFRTGDKLKEILALF